MTYAHLTNRFKRRYVTRILRSARANVQHWRRKRLSLDAEKPEHHRMTQAYNILEELSQARIEGMRRILHALFD